MGAEPHDGELLGGRYAVEELLGRGGTAEVHRAWDHERGRAVAVKIFREGAAPALADGGAREVRALRGVSHPAVVGLQGWGVDAEGRSFVVMDFIDGQSLDERLRSGPLPTAEVVALGVVLAEALAAVHARGIVHRDVKPANVLLDTAGRPWLTDFGISRIVDATPLTATGIVVGTGAYMAPEQVRGQTVGPPADVYALGLVLLEAATGRREYEGSTLESALARLHRAPVVPAELDEPLAATVRRMTAARPADRPSGGEVVVMLRGSRVAPRLAIRGRRAAPAAALAGLVAAAAAGVLALTGAGNAPGAPTAVADAPPTAAVPAVPSPGGASPQRAGAGSTADGGSAAQPVTVALVGSAVADAVESADPAPGDARPAVRSGGAARAGGGAPGPTTGAAAPGTGAATPAPSAPTTGGGQGGTGGSGGSATDDDGDGGADGGGTAKKDKAEKKDKAAKNGKAHGNGGGAGDAEPGNSGNGNGNGNGKGKGKGKGGAAG